MNEILNNLKENLIELSNIENEISILELAIYEKQKEELKNKKLNEMNQYFNDQLKKYNRKKS